MLFLRGFKKFKKICCSSLLLSDISSNAYILPNFTSSYWKVHLHLFSPVEVRSFSFVFLSPSIPSTLVQLLRTAETASDPIIMVLSSLEWKNYWILVGYLAAWYRVVSHTPPAIRHKTYDCIQWNERESDVYTAWDMLLKERTCSFPLSSILLLRTCM